MPIRSAVRLLVAACLLLPFATGSTASAGPCVVATAPSEDVATAPSDFNELDGVDLRSASDGWAVGGVDVESTSEGFVPLIERWDGSGWSIVPSPDTADRDDLLLGVSADAANDAWAVGALGSFVDSTGQPLVEHWNGTAWSIVPTPTLPDELGSYVRGVKALAPDDVWAVGGEGPAGTVSTLIEHWDGTAWSVVRSPRAAGVLFSIDATAGDFWTTGYRFDPITGRIEPLAEHWNGHTWRITRTPTPLQTTDPGEDYNVLESVRVTPTGVWAVGQYGNPDLGVRYHTLVMHRTDRAWERVPAPSPGRYGASLHAVAAPSGTTFIAVGALERRNATEVPLVERWDGTRWRRLDAAGTGPLRADSSAGGLVVGVGTRLVDDIRYGTYAVTVCAG